MPRLAAWLSLAALLVTFSSGPASAAPEIHRLNLVLSAVPTQIDGGDANELIDFINDTALDPRGLKTMDKITYAWLFEGQLRYFVRPNFAVNAGVGQVKTQSFREYLPFIQAAIQLRAEVISVPINVGAAYYLAPYTQGDFQARAFVGGGFSSLVYNHFTLQQESSGIPGVPTIRSRARGDAPGYYVEAGGHMFFAARYSVILSAMYRSAKIKGLIDTPSGAPALDPQGEPFTLDMSGLGARMGIAIGF